MVVTAFAVDFQAKGLLTFPNCSSNVLASSGGDVFAATHRRDAIMLRMCAVSVNCRSVRRSIVVYFVNLQSRYYTVTKGFEQNHMDEGLRYHCRRKA